MPNEDIIEICNEDLASTQYDSKTLEKNLNNLDMMVILRTQTLEINFIVNYILNEEYQILQSEKDIDIWLVLCLQKHISKEELMNELEK